jgi:hypothetical protein
MLFVLRRRRETDAPREKRRNAGIRIAGFESLFCNIEERVSGGQVQEFPDRFGEIKNPNINPSGLKRDECSQTGSVNGGNTSQIYGKILSVTMNGLTEKLRLASLHQSAAAKKDNGTGMVFNSNSQHG